MLTIYPVKVYISPVVSFFSPIVQIRSQTSYACYTWLTAHISSSPPSLLLFFLVFHLLKKPSHLSCNVSYILNFAFSVPVVSFNKLVFR